MNPRALGWKKDPYPPRRTYAARAAIEAPLPASVDNRSLLPAPLDQGDLGSCVANGVAAAIYASHTRAGVRNPLLASRRFIWFAARASEGNELENTGCIISSAVECLNLIGFCPEYVMPYSEDFASPPPVAAFMAAFAQRLRHGDTDPAYYAAIDGSGEAAWESLKVAMACGYCPVFGCQVSEAFTQWDFDPSVPLDPPSEDDLAGGHCMVMAGYTEDDNVLIRGSWGAEMSDCIFTKRYALATMDRTIVKHAPEFVK